MTTDIHIPPEAEEAAARAIGEETYVGNKQTLKDAARAALLAGLRAWPGRFGTELEDHTGVYRKIILPLPREKQDD